MHRNDVENAEFLIYTAGPLFTEDDLQTCNTVEKMLTNSNIDFFSPRLGTAEQGKELGKVNAILTDAMKTQISQGQIPTGLKRAAARRDDVARDILNANLHAINHCNLMIANVDNRDAGTMFEIGYAVAISTPVITYSAHDYGVNLMIGQSVLCHCLTWDDLLQSILKAKEMIESGEYQERHNIYFQVKRDNDLRPMD